MKQKNKVIWAGRHEGLLADISRGCSYGDWKSLEEGGKILADFIPDNCILVPMPSHIGYSTTMYTLCGYICNAKKGQRPLIEDALKCVPHESSRILKYRGEIAEPPKMYLARNNFARPDAKIFIIDNCIGTGATAAAALKVLPKATVLALTKA